MQAGSRKSRLLHLDALQVRAADGEPREVQAAQVAAQLLEQGEDVGRAVALAGLVLGAELVEQGQQVLFDLGVGAQFAAQSLEEGVHQQAHLGLAHIVFGLRLLQSVAAHLLRGTLHDLLGEAFAQCVGEELHHHRLQAEAGLLSPFEQRAPSQRLQRFQNPRAHRPGMQDLQEGVERCPFA